jgi:hypothetical protein
MTDVLKECLEWAENTEYGPEKAAWTRAVDEIERLREEKEILKIALQNIKECIAHRGENEKDRNDLADHAYIVTAIILGLGAVK